MSRKTSRVLQQEGVVARLVDRLQAPADGLQADLLHDADLVHLDGHLDAVAEPDIHAATVPSVCAGAHARA